VFDEPVPFPEGTHVIVEEQMAGVPSGSPVTAQKRSPASYHHRNPGTGLLDVVGLFPDEDLAEIEEAIRDCRKVDADGW